MDQNAAVIVMIICGSLLSIIISLVVSYWIIRAAVSHSLARHRDELREMLRAR